MDRLVLRAKERQETVRDHFGERQRSETFDEAADLNGDGVVNVLDRLQARNAVQNASEVSAKPGAQDSVPNPKAVSGSSEPTPISAVENRPADLSNEDLRKLIEENFGRDSSSPSWDPRADLN